MLLQLRARWHLAQQGKICLMLANAGVVELWHPGVSWCELWYPEML